MHPCLVIRHGIAHDTAPSGRDEDRALNDRGRAALAESMPGLVAAARTPEVILTSPFLRARETADIVAAAFNGAPVEPLAALAAGARAGDMLATVACQCDRAGGAFALVGHEPDLGSFISYALAATARGFHSPRKGGVCLLEFPALPRAGNATLEWALEPEHLQAFGRARR
jgi:phosphohistidine phosphatase